MNPQHPHGDQPVLHAGPAISKARLVAILIHGRGASAQDILGLSRGFSAADVAYLAPQAQGNTWYPYSFLTPMEQNQPFLDSALRRVEELIADVERHGTLRERVALIGFSQGACLALEFAARHARRYAAVVAFSGGLIGPPGTPRDYAGTMAATPVFLGCSDVDAHIPLERVRESAEVFRRLGATVDERIYPRMGHTINGDELQAADLLLEAQPTP